MAPPSDPTRQQIATDLRRAADARDQLAAQYPDDREVFQAEARAYRNAAAIAEGDTSMLHVLTAHVLPPGTHHRP